MTSEFAYFLKSTRESPEGNAPSVTVFIDNKSWQVVAIDVDVFDRLAWHFTEIRVHPVALHKHVVPLSRVEDFFELDYRSRNHDCEIRAVWSPDNRCFGEF